MCTRTNPKRTMPERAITAFFPTADPKRSKNQGMPTPRGARARASPPPSGNRPRRRLISQAGGNAGGGTGRAAPAPARPLLRLRLVLDGHLAGPGARPRRAPELQPLGALPGRRDQDLEQEESVGEAGPAGELEPLRGGPPGVAQALEAHERGDHLLRLQVREREAGDERSDGFLDHPVERRPVHRPLVEV